MPGRILTAIAFSALLAGCAGEQGASPLLRSGASMLGGPAHAAETQAADLKRAERQTVAARIIAAIALERVTGRTPDPSRFHDLR